MLQNKNSKILIFVLIIVIFVVASSSLLLNYLSPKINDNTQIPTPLPFPSSIVSRLNSDFSVIYEAKGEDTGRTILYDVRSKAKYGSGIGTVHSGDAISHMVGLFKSWEDIPETQDRYIVLINPRDNQVLGKYRVVFEATKTTELQIVDLDDIIKNNTYKGASEHLYYIDEVSDDTLDKLIRQGDAIQLASYYIDGISTNIVKDDQDIPYAATIYLRRYGGREELAKEMQ